MLDRRARQGRDGAQANSRMTDYLVAHGDDLAFTKFFWKGCEPNKYEVKQYSKYVQSMLLHNQGKSTKRISENVEVNGASIYKWVRFKQKPKLAHYLHEFIRLGKPRRAWIWLSINNSTRHAVPLGPLVQVPLRIACWRDVQSVLDQLRPLQQTGGAASPQYRFDFLLGIMIGDASKKRQEEWHRHLELVLSHRYATNLRIGDFATACGLGIGIRMKRALDIAPYGRKPRGFYVWRSQSTALVDWLYNVCLGLKDDELTTYDPVRMDWALLAPANFRRGLLQGLAESDGSVSIASQTVEFWIGPSWDFVKQLLLTFGVPSFRNREALSVTKNQAMKLYQIPAFSPLIKTARYQRLERLALAGHIGHGKRVPRKMRNRIMELGREGISAPRISERILDEFGVILSFEAVQRWAKRADARVGFSEAKQAAWRELVPMQERQ